MVCGCVSGVPLDGNAQSYSTAFSLDAYGNSGDVPASTYSIDAATYGLDPEKYRLSEVNINGSHTLDGRIYYFGNADSRVVLDAGVEVQLSQLSASNYFDLSHQGRQMYRNNQVDFKLNYANQPVSGFDLETLLVRKQ